MALGARSQFVASRRSFPDDLSDNPVGVDRSNRLFVTDVWRHGPEGREAIARYSSIPEPARAGTTKLR